MRLLYLTEDQSDWTKFGYEKVRLIRATARHKKPKERSRKSRCF